MAQPLMSDAAAWAKQQFAGSCPADPRLGRAAVRYAANQAADPTGSTARVSAGSKSAQASAYRFLGNPRVTAASIDIGPFNATVEACAGSERVLCIQDTTSVAVHANELKQALKSSGSPSGFIVHTAIMVDGVTGEYSGAIDQHRWCRKGGEKLCSFESEGDKWAETNRNVRERIGDLQNVIHIADREADVLAYLKVMTLDGERFVVRAKNNRSAWLEKAGVFGAVRGMPILGERIISVEQRGSVPKNGIEPGRKARPRQQIKT
jgi:hypothetical protein